jgi:hypothetical protein
LENINDTFSFLLVALLFAVIFAIMIVIFVRLKRGGGSMTTIALGATDEFLNRDRLRAAETIVNENAGKSFEDKKIREKEMLND